MWVVPLPVSQAQEVQGMWLPICCRSVLGDGVFTDVNVCCYIFN